MTAELLRADDPVVLPHLVSAGRLLAVALDVADQRAHGWTLIGALMVMLDEREAGTPTRPATADADAVVDARGATDATRTMVTLSQTQGWELGIGHVDVFGHGYKYVRDDLEFDVLAPEGLGARADLTTVPPLRAPQLAGTRQALDRTQPVAVHLDGRAQRFPSRPAWRTGSQGLCRCHRPRPGPTAPPRRPRTSLQTRHRPRGVDDDHLGPQATPRRSRAHLGDGVALS